MTDVDFSKLGKRIQNLDGLPKELRDQLQIGKADELEDHITSVISEIYAGMATIDEILVGVFHKSNVIHKRPFIVNKLYRMAKDGLVHSVKGKKGVYTTNKELVTLYGSK